MRYIKARAKINLGLNIVGREGSMHILDSIMAPVKDIYDEVKIGARGDGEINILYRGGEAYENDTAYRAAKAVTELFGTAGVDVEIAKGIPEGAGLGGSSADAAAVFRGMEELFGVKVPPEVMRKVGSDVYMQYLDAPCRVRGLGEVAEKIDFKGGLFGVLLLSGKSDTGKVYARYDLIGGENGDIDALIGDLKSKNALKPFNALERAAVSLLPEIGENLKILREAGFLAGMTGSGGGVFGLERQEEVFERRLKKLGEVANYIAFVI